VVALRWLRQLTESVRRAYGKAEQKRRTVKTCEDDYSNIWLKFKGIRICDDRDQRYECVRVGSHLSLLPRPVQHARGILGAVLPPGLPVVWQVLDLSSCGERKAKKVQCEPKRTGEASR